MKKIFSIILVLLFTLTLSVSVRAEEATWNKTFFDDFESYGTGKVETQTAFTDVWTNDGWSGVNPDPVDINDVATIKSEGGNQYLNINYESSFFYMSPHSYRAKNFEVEFDTRSHDLTDAWIGVNMRKEYRDIRYNGGTSLMLYFRSIYIYDEAEQIVGEALIIQALRGGSLSTTDLDGLLVGENKIEYIYPEDGPIDPEQQIKSNWFNIRIVVSETENDNESLYEVYINDEHKTSLTYARASLNTYGYIGLHGCTGDLDVDNFSIASNDEVAPPPIVRVNRLIDSAGNLGVPFEFPGAEEGDLDVVDDADGVVVVQVLQPNNEVLTIDEGTYSFTPTLPGIHTLSYIVENGDGSTSTADFLINVGEAEDPDDEPDDEPIDDPDDEPIDEPDDESNDDVEENTGSTGLIVAIISGVVIVIGAGVFFIIKRK